MRRGARAGRPAREVRKTVTVVFSRRDRLDRARRAARPRGAAARDGALLRRDARGDRAPRRHGREVHRRRGHGRVRDPDRCTRTTRCAPCGRRPRCARRSRRLNEELERECGVAHRGRERASTPARWWRATRPERSRHRRRRQRRRPPRAGGAARRDPARRATYRARPRRRPSRAASSRSTLKGKTEPVAGAPAARGRRRRRAVRAPARRAAGRPRATSSPSSAQAYERAIGERTPSPVHDPRRRGDRQVAARARVRSTASRATATVLVGRCLSYGEGITYWPLVEIARAACDDARGRRRCDDRVTGEAGGAAPEEIVWAVRQLFERLAEERPLVVVLDDLHWAEPTLPRPGRARRRLVARGAHVLVCARTPGAARHAADLGGRQAERHLDPARAALARRSPSA